MGKSCERARGRLTRLSLLLLLSFPLFLRASPLLRGLLDHPRDHTRPETAVVLSLARGILRDASKLAFVLTLLPPQYTQDMLSTVRSPRESQSHPMTLAFQSRFSQSLSSRRHTGDRERESRDALEEVL